MKRFLSTLLALAMLISLVPAVFADGTETATEKGVRILYSVGTDSTSVTSTEPYAYLITPDYITTNGFYDFYDTNQNISEAGTDIRTRTKSLQLSNRRAVVYEVYIPVAGNYTMEMYNSTYAAAKSANVYLSTAAELKANGGVYKSTNSNYVEEIKASLGTYIGYYDCAKGADSKTFGTLVSEPNVITGFEIPEAGYYTIAFYADGGNVSVGDFYLTCGEDAIVPMYAPLTITDDTATVASTVVMSDKTRQTLDNTFTVTYDSSNKAVATVAADGKITKLSNGKTEITATVEKNGGVAMSTVEYEVTGVVEETPKYTTVTFSAMAVGIPAGAENPITVTGAAGTVDGTLERGTTVSITANEKIEGYKFVGWKRGSADNGAFIGKTNPLTLTVLSNTFITAVYASDEDEKTPMIEYYNENGDYLETKTPEEEAPTPDAITGYSFTTGSWFIADGIKLVPANVNAFTRAVAIHTANTVSASVTVNGAEWMGAMAFNTPIAAGTLTGDNNCWKRGENIVSYDDTYTYYLWGDAEITQAKIDLPEKKIPLIHIEYSDTHGAYMIEYDEADYEIAEVGIIFGNGSQTVESGVEKYTSQRKSDHGQFTAKSDAANATTAKGYLIYEDDGQYKVIYAD